MEYSHPHPDKKHLVRVYRAYILSSKRRWGTARGLVHYRDYIQLYLHAKRWTQAMCPCDCHEYGEPYCDECFDTGGHSANAPLT